MSPLHPDPLVLLPPQEILDTLCLNDCSGNGQCSKGLFLFLFFFRLNNFLVKVSVSVLLAGLVLIVVSLCQR